MINFTNLTRLVRINLAMNERTFLAIDKSSPVNITSNGIENVANALKWNVEKWMNASSLYRVWMEVAYHLETILDNNDPADDTVLDAEAAKLIAALSAQSLAVVLRGPSYTNGLQMMEEATMIEANRKRLDAFGLSSHNLGGAEMVATIFAGIEAKEAEERAKAERKPAFATYTKKGGCYFLNIRNRSNEILESVPLDSTTQKLALEEMNAWLDARELPRLSITKED